MSIISSIDKNIFHFHKIIKTTHNVSEANCFLLQVKPHVVCCFALLFVKIETVIVNAADITRVQSLSKVYMLRYFKVDRGNLVGRPLPY